MCLTRITESQLETINERSCEELKIKLVKPFPRVDNLAWLLTEPTNVRCTSCLSYVYFNDKPYCVKDVVYQKTNGNVESRGGSA